MHCGDDVALETHYVPRHSQRTESVLTFFAQDGVTRNLVYANTSCTKATQPDEALAFARHWKAATGRLPELLVFDSKVTTGAGLAAIDAGVDAVDVANAAWAGTTSQVSMSALIAATDGTDRETGLSLDAAASLEPYFEAVRLLYGPFESGLPGPTGRVYHHEIPGGQLSNLRQQAISLGLGERFEAIEDIVRGGQHNPRQHRQGDPVLEGGRRSRAGAGRGERLAG